MNRNKVEKMCGLLQNMETKRKKIQFTWNRKEYIWNEEREREEIAKEKK